MRVEKLPPVKSTLQPSNHPYLNGAWTPQHEEVTATDLDVIEGRIPDDIDGIYLRNTENQLHQPLGRYHPFDGDGMIHQIDFSSGKASYRNRFVRTRCFPGEHQQCVRIAIGRTELRKRDSLLKRGEALNKWLVLKACRIEPRIGRCRPSREHDYRHRDHRQAEPLGDLS